MSSFTWKLQRKKGEKDGGGSHDKRRKTSKVGEMEEGDKGKYHGLDLMYSSKGPVFVQECSEVRWLVVRANQSVLP